jgi:hypothetical protein
VRKRASLAFLKDREQRDGGGRCTPAIKHDVREKEKIAIVALLGAILVIVIYRFIARKRK